MVKGPPDFPNVTGNNLQSCPEVYEAQRGMHSLSGSQNAPPEELEGVLFFPKTRSAFLTPGGGGLSEYPCT